MNSATPFDLAPATLVNARTLCHLACQWPSKAARANLAALPDDSHSNLGWNTARQALVSHPVDSAQQFQLGFSFASSSLIWLKNDALAASLDCDDATDESTRTWVDQQLESAGLNGTSHAKMPYELEAVPADAVFPALSEQIAALGAWYEYAQKAYDQLVGEFGDVSINPTPVRCWPHHFDLGTLFALQGGDPETAPSIGVGLSPGDASYAEPYFYCSPWPVPNSKELPTSPEPWCWHTEGFVSLVCPASELHMSSDINGVLRDAFTCVKKTV